MKFHCRSVLFLLFVLGASGLFAAGSGSGRVIFVDGEVTANGAVAETGDILPGKTILKTGKGAEIEVVFDEKNIFRLGPNTVAEVDFSQVQKTVTLQQGVFTSVLKKLAKAAGASFNLKTPTVTAGVRGTSFHVQTDGTRTYFCTCNGSVVLNDGDAADQVILTNAHHGARVFTKEADGTIAVTTAGLEGHTDASIETLAQKIRVPLDWTTPDLSHQ